MPPHSTQLLISIHVNTPWKSNSNKTWLDLETYLHELGKSSQWIGAYLVRIFVKVTLTLCSNVFSKGWLKTLPLIYSEFWWEASQTLGCLTGWHSQVVKIKPPKQTLLNVEFMRQLLTIKKKCICSETHVVSLIFLLYLMVIQGDRTITIMCQRQTWHFLSTIKSSDISEHPNPATADRGPPLQSHLITAWSQTRNINSIPAWWDSFTSQWGCGQSVTWYAQLQRQCLWFCTLRYINHILHSGSSPKKKKKKDSGMYVMS